MTYPPLTAPVDQTKNPPLHEMEWQRLERLTVDLYGYEPNIASSDDYGIPGQSDHGVDVIARRRDGNEEEVASCKVKKDGCKAKDLVGWSDDFFKHWKEVWSKHNLKRFVMAVAAPDTGATDIQEQITKERERFRKLGIEYEFWGPNQFVQKLRPQRALTARYLGEHWANIICGPAAEDYGVRIGSAEAMISAATIAQLAELQGRLSGLAARQIEEALNDLRAGRLEKVRAVLAEFREAKFWAQLQPESQAKILRLSASVAIRDQQLDVAEELNAEAESIFPAEEPRIAAHIALERQGPEAAIAALGTPVSLAGKQLRASLLIGRGSFDELEKVLEDIVSLAGDDPETLRLSAFYHLAKNDRATALAEIRRAEAIAAEWTSIQLAGVVVRYSHSLSPSVRAEWLFYPNPVDLALVLSGPSVDGLLNEALALLERYEASAGEKEARLWRLAIVANQHNGQEQASEYARSILSDTPDDAAVIAWCLTRRFDVDLEPSAAVLRARYATGDLDLFHTRVLGLLLTVKEVADAAEFLRAHADAQSHAAREEAERWIARLEGTAVEGGDKNEDRIPDTLRHIQATDDWTQMPELLASTLTQTPPDPGAIIAAQMVAEFDKWELLAPWVDRLLSFGTATAVRLAAFASSRAGEPSRTLAILDEYQPLFGGELPADMQRLRVDSLARIGDLRGALQAADQIETRTQLLEDKLFKAELMVQIGDLRGTVPPIREALRSGKLTGVQALRWSQILQNVDRDLSTQLWRRAVSREGELAEKYAVAAMHQAFQLGLDNEIGALMPIVHERAKQSKEARLIDLDELKEIIEEQREVAREDEKLYLDGIIPTHLFVRGKVGAFLAIHAGTEPDSGGRLRVRLIRSAARPRNVDVGLPWASWRIHLDISGLLEANQLGLLDQLESQGNPILVSPRLPAMLIEMQQAALATQRSRQEAKKLIQRLILDHAIRPGSRDENVLTIVFPKEDGGEVSALEELVRGMGPAGLIAPDDVPGLLARLGRAKEPVAALDLSGVTALHFEPSALEQAAALDLLPLLAKNFRVTYPASYDEELQAAISAGEHEDRLADIAGKLRERVAEGIKSGLYQTLPDSADADDQDDGLLIGSLKDILAAPPIENGVAWVDDRLVTSFPRAGTMPVVGVVDVLETLAKERIISDDELRDKLTHLRSTGAAFIPVKTEEVLDALIGAAIVGGEVIETHALRAIRRNLAACGRVERNLKIGDADPQRQGRPEEIEYPRTAMRVLSDALQEIWTRPGLSYEECYARSDWLWFNVRHSRANRDIPADDPAAAQDQIEVMQIGHCANLAIDIGGVVDERREDRLQFLNWLWNRVIYPKVLVDPTFVGRLTDYLSAFYSSLLNEDRAEQPHVRAILDKLIVTRIQRLPDPVRDALNGAPFMRRWGRTVRQVTVGRFKFESRRFWKAIRAARLYGPSNLRSNTGKRFIIRRDGDGFKLSGRTKIRLADPLFDVVASRRAELPAALERYLDSLDIGIEERPAILKRVSSLIEPAPIAEVLDDLRSAAAVTRYRLVGEKLRQRGTFNAEIFEPVGAEQLRRYLSLTAPDTQAAEIGHAFDAVSEQHSPQEAFLRLSGLPHSAISEAVEKLDDDALDSFVKLARTPVALIHVAAAVFRRRGLEATVPILERFVTAIELYGDAFRSLLRWTEKFLFKDPAWRALSKATKLALLWAHADRLLHIFMSNRADPAGIKKHFDHHAPSLSAPDLLGLRGLASDAASAQGISGPVILYHGLAEIFGVNSVPEMLSERVAERVRSILIQTADGITAPHISVLLRRPSQDAMGTFLGKTPVAIFPEDMEPDKLCSNLIEGALNAIEAGGEQVPAGWAQLGAFSTGGMSSEQQARFSTLVRNADLWALAIGDAELRYHMWRALLIPLLPDEHEWVADQAVALAAKCREAYAGRFSPTGDPPSSPAMDALTELVELSSIIAGATESDELTAFSELLARIVAAWPEAAPRLRVVVDSLLSYTPASRAGPLWDLYHLMRTYY